jgi:8-oxo-dGTP pyrophosphatase MutT (NUDIX family)
MEEPLPPEPEPLLQQLRSHLESTPATRLGVGFASAGLREAAVLVPIFRRGGDFHLLFTKRPMTLRTHAGQIAFPGGARDPEDLTPLHTALRESEEEVGIPQHRVRVLGLLDEIPTITRYRILPFVGVIPGDLTYVPSEEEIDQIIEVPLRTLMDPTIHRAELQVAGAHEREIFFYDYGPHVIWGATARILKGLLSIIAELPAYRAP